MLTLGNLLCGFAAIFYASREVTDKHFLPELTPLTIAASLIFIGMLLDALDGRVARMTNQTSPLGEQLDSMADMVTFGVAPAFMVIQLIDIGTPFFGEITKWDGMFERVVLVSAGIYVACCGLRLARFNVEVEDDSVESHMWFKGLPSPGAGGAVAALILLHQHLLVTDENVKASTAVAITMVVIMFLVGLAMVSNLRYSHAANRFFSGQGSFGYVVALAIVIVVLLLIEPRMAIAGGFVCYALSAPTMWVLKLFGIGRGGKKLGEDDNEDEDGDESIEGDSSLRIGS